MPVAVHDLVDQVLHRVRDPMGVIASRDFVMLMLSDAQRIVNAKLAITFDTQALVTEPLRCFYPIVDLVPESQKVLYVRQGQRDLIYVPWRNFWAMKRGWPREVAEQMQLWSVVGRDILVVWPTLRAATTLTVLSARLTAPLVNEAETPDLPEDALPMVVDLAEVFVLLKMRKVDLATEAMQSFAGRMKERAA